MIAFTRVQDINSTGELLVTALLTEGKRRLAYEGRVPLLYQTYVRYVKAADSPDPSEACPFAQVPNALRGSP